MVSGFLAFLCIFLFLVCNTPDCTKYNPDTLRDLQIAADCINSSVCILRGPVSGLPGSFHQGGMWTPLHLGLILSFGLGLPESRNLIAGSLAFAFFFLYLMLVRHYRPFTGFLGMVFLLFLIDWRFQVLLEPQWSPSLTPLPSMLLVFSEYLAIETRKERFRLGSCLCLAILVQLHLVAWFYLPFLLICWLLFPMGRPARSWITGIALIAVSIFSASRDALPSTYQIMQFLDVVASGLQPSDTDTLEQAYLVTGYRGNLVLVLALASTCALLIRKRLENRRLRPGEAGLLILVVGPTLLFWTVASILGFVVHARYLTLILFPTAVLSAISIGPLTKYLPSIDPWLDAWRIRWISWAIHPLLMAMVLLSIPAPTETECSEISRWTFEELDDTVRLLLDRGISVADETQDVLIGPRVLPVLQTLHMREKGTRTVAGHSDDGSRETNAVLILRKELPSSIDPSDRWSVIERNGIRTLLIPFRPWLDWKKAQVMCLRGRTPSGAGIDRLLNEEPMGFGDESQWNSWSSVSGFNMPTLFLCDYAFLRVPIRLLADESRELIPLSTQDWTARVLDIQGLSFAMPNSGGTVILDRGQTGRSGLLVIEWRRTGHRDDSFLPAIAELGEEDDALRALIMEED